MKLNNFTGQAARLFHGRKMKIEPVAFNDVSRGIMSCLVCMPGKLELIKSAAEILPEIAQAFPNRSLKVMLTSSVDPQSHDIIKRFIVIRAEESDYDTFSLPRKQFLAKITTGGVGIAIDLDPRPNLFNAVSVLRSGALIRTTFDKGMGLPYYNLIIGLPGEDSSSRAVHRIIADVLGNFGVH
jgi:hypothetical protein